jgi:anti-sigma regulatory factor (Ser/Thr protein kinase)
MTTLTPTIRDRRRLGYELQLAARPEAVSAARRFTVATLQAWDIDREVIDVAALLVSELVTNAVDHTRHHGPWTPGETEPTPATIPAVVWVRVRDNGASLIIEVWDNNLTPPTPQPQSLDTEHGRGLFLIDVLSQQWGYYWPKAGGKIVWASVRHSQQRGSAATII